MLSSPSLSHPSSTLAVSPGPVLIRLRDCHDRVPSKTMTLMREWRWQRLKGERKEAAGRKTQRAKPATNW